MLDFGSGCGLRLRLFQQQFGICGLGVDIFSLGANQVGMSAAPCRPSSAPAKEKGRASCGVTFRPDMRSVCFHCTARGGAIHRALNPCHCSTDCANDLTSRALPPTAHGERRLVDSGNVSTDPMLGTKPSGRTALVCGCSGTLCLNFLRRGLRRPQPRVSLEQADKCPIHT